jgi:hypothetical protein
VKHGTKVVALALTIGTGVIAPASGAPRERTETVPYERSSGAHLMDTLWIEVTGVPEARPAAGETAVSIVLEDDSGRPVAATVHQGKHELGEICGATDVPLALVSRRPVHVHVYSGPGCLDVSAPTKGSITFTFTR